MTGQLRRCRDQLSETLGRAPTVPELAAALAVQERDVDRALEAERIRDAVPLEARESGVPTSAPETVVETEERVLLERGAQALDERERRIVFLRFHADMTEREIARAVGISQAQVSRLLAAALEKLRAALSEESGADTTAARVISPDQARARRGGTRMAGVGGARRETTMPNQDAAKRKVSPSYSGRFLVRLPGELHEQLALAAEREHVSLNRFVTDALAAAVAGPSVPATSSREEEPHEDEGGARSSQPRGRAFRVALATNLVVVVLAGLLALALLILAMLHGV